MTQDIASLPFAQAAAIWLDTRKPYLSPRSYIDYTHHIKKLGEFFEKRALADIGPDEIRAYQKARMAVAGGAVINHEVSCLQQMMKRVGMWGEIQPDYQPMPLPKESPHRALTPQEEERLYRIGAINPRWDVAYCAYVLSINTTCGPGELRHLRLMDVNLPERTMRVQPEGAKNAGRIRVIPLNDMAARAIEYLLKRAEKLGSVEPAHYLIPYRIKKGTYDRAKLSSGISPASQGQDYKSCPFFFLPSFKSDV